MKNKSWSAMPDERLQYFYILSIKKVCTKIVVIKRNDQRFYCQKCKEKVLHSVKQWISKNT